MRLAAFPKIVECLLKLDLWPKQEPIGAWLPKRHPDAARIHHTSSPNLSIELHVSMAADDEGRIASRKNRQQAVFRCKASETLIFVSRRGMAKEKVAKAGNLKTQRLRPTSHESLLPRKKLLHGPLDNGAKRFRDGRGLAACRLFKHSDLAISLNALQRNPTAQRWFLVASGREQRLLLPR